MQESIVESQDFVLACALSEVPIDGAIISRNFDGKSILFARRSPGDDQIDAFESRCPHMQGPLRFGRVVEGEVICPWHFFRFSITTGAAAACDKSTMKLKIYPTKIIEENVHIQMMG